MQIDNVTIDMHRWYAVIKKDGEVAGVVGNTEDGLRLYDSVDEYLGANS